MAATPTPSHWRRWAGAAVASLPARDRGCARSASPLWGGNTRALTGCGQTYVRILLSSSPTLPRGGKDGGSPASSTTPAGIGPLCHGNKNSTQGRMVLTGYEAHGDRGDRGVRPRTRGRSRRPTGVDPDGNGGGSGGGGDAAHWRLRAKPTAAAASSPLPRRGEPVTAAPRAVGAPSDTLAGDRLVGCGRHGRAPVCGRDRRALVATLVWGGQCYWGGGPLPLSSHSTVPPLERLACPRVPPVAASAVAAGWKRQRAGGAPVVEDGSLPSQRPMLLCLRTGLTLSQSFFQQGPRPSSCSPGPPTSPPSPPTRLDQPCTEEGGACCKRVQSTSALAVWNALGRAKGLWQQEIGLLPARSLWWSPLGRDWSSSRGCQPQTSSARIAACQKYTPSPGGHNNSARP